VRFGSLASADFEELRDVFAVWRRTMEAFMAATARSESNHLIGHALDELERSAREEIGRWADNRVDLIAIGASAGGIPALSDLLTRLNADVPATILVVLHLSARTPSLVPAILARNCSLVVTPAVDGAALYLGHVYVAVPGRHLIVTDGRINLMDGLAVHFVKPSVDVLFESAAEIFGPHLVSTVLSGTGADGSTGTRAVHERHGITLAQDPESAEFRGMPEAAIATGTVDCVGSVPQLAATLQRLTTEGRGELGL